CITDQRLQFALGCREAPPFEKSRKRTQFASKRQAWDCSTIPGSAVPGGLRALKTRKIAVPVAPARREHPLARACRFWPPSRLARKNHHPSLPPPIPCGRE